MKIMNFDTILLHIQIHNTTSSFPTGKTHFSRPDTSLARIPIRFSTDATAAFPVSKTETRGVHSRSNCVGKSPGMAISGLNSAENKEGLFLQPTKKGSRRQCFVRFAPKHKSVSVFCTVACYNWGWRIRNCTNSCRGEMWDFRNVYFRTEYRRRKFILMNKEWTLCF